MRNISIIIPTYKEKENIFKLTKKNFKSLSQILIVDDTENLNLKKRFKSKRIYFLRKNKKGRGSICKKFKKWFN